MNWSECYRAGETPWDEGGPHPALVDFIAQRAPFAGRILVPGCGRGHEVRAVSTSQNRVTGLDIAPDALVQAREFPRVGNEEYTAGNLFALEPELRSVFDWVAEHTCFCAIEPEMRPAYVEGVAAALKPGGMMFAIFYLDPAVDRRPPYGVTIGEVDRLFGPRFEVLEEWAPERTFEGREGRELVRLMKARPR